MPKVTLPRADWDFIIMMLEDAQNPMMSDPLLKDINDQLDRQEY